MKRLAMMAMVSVCAVAMMACSAGPRGEQGPPGEPGAQGAPGPQGPPGTGSGDAFTVAGERVTPLLVKADDGATAVLGWWDTELSQECEWIRFTPPGAEEHVVCGRVGTRYVTEPIVDKVVWYADAACTVYVSTSKFLDVDHVDWRRWGVWHPTGQQYMGDVYAWDTVQGACFFVGPSPYAYEFVNVTDTFVGGPVVH